MDASIAKIRECNLVLTQQNQSLRQQIASLRNGRLELQHQVIETIRAKESFKTEVIKLITQAQNTFERLKTFIEHTTSTPPPSTSLLSREENLQRRPIVGRNLQQQPQNQHLQHGILRQIPILKDTEHIPKPQPSSLPKTPQSSRANTSVEDNNADMHSIDEKIRKLDRILMNYKDDINLEIDKTPDTGQKVRRIRKTIADLTALDPKGIQRCSKRMLSNAGEGKHEAKRLAAHKDNMKTTCPIRDITNATTMRLAEGGTGLGGVTPRRSARKRKIII